MEGYGPVCDCEYCGYGMLLAVDTMEGYGAVCDCEYCGYAMLLAVYILWRGLVLCVIVSIVGMLYSELYIYYGGLWSCV